MANQAVFGEAHERATWGDTYWSTGWPSPRNSAYNLSWEVGRGLDIRSRYIDSSDLTNMLNTSYQKSDDLSFAFVHDFPGASRGAALYTIGNIQTPVVQYLTKNGLDHLHPYWKTCMWIEDYSSQDLTWFHHESFQKWADEAAQFDAKLRSDVRKYYQDNGDEGRNYWAIVALSVRQIMAGYAITSRYPTDCVLDCSGDLWDRRHTLIFQKEISSNGNTNTVDVIYPAMPFFLYANPKLLRYVLEPLFRMQELKLYPNKYAMHDIGAHFPNATGHVEGNDEFMPIEECGNMILISYAYYKFSGDIEFLERHYDMLEQWADYLVDYTLTPSYQLSTDDFAGHLANQTNLALKGILSIQAMSMIGTALGKSHTFEFAEIAASFYKQWEHYAVDPTGQHTLLAYEHRASWGLLYNLFPDKLLGLNIVPESVYDMQSAWYPQQSTALGVPLDSRHSLTKTDWEMFTAATCSPPTRRLFVNSLAYWLNNTASGLPFPDLHNTIGNGVHGSFSARPVAGGHFSLLALQRSQNL